VCYWLLLHRPPTDPELQDALQVLAEYGRDALLTRVTTSPEFQQQYRQRQSGREDPRASGLLAQGLDGFGDEARFVSLCYEVLFGRPADPGGLDHYTARLREGATRLSIVGTFSDSDEFEGRVRRLAPAASRIPRDVQLCELANPAKWDNPDWHAILRSLVSVPTDQASMHRKAYEYAQTIFGLTRLGKLDQAARVLSVGAGHEVILYWLANHVGRVIATDLYEGEWQSAFAREGNPDVLRDPAAYAPFPYRKDRLVFVKMEGSRLAFRDDSFDVAYSLSSIEHFGGVEGARRSVADMARVLKPGGILALATEWCVRGRAAGEVFSPEQVRAIIDHPRLRLVEPIDDRVWDRYETEPVDLRVDRFQTPHMLLKHDEAIFTSVFVFLEKT
jgi:SAM-dependent methyltransferase